MGSNRTPIDKSMTIEKAIKQGGYYNTDGDWNNITISEDYPGKILRGRVEALILRDGKLFMYLKENGKYRIPGGGFDKGVLNKDQVFMEVKEESKIIIDNIRFTGVKYIQLYDEIWKHSDKEIPYDGTYNEVYIADYKDEYTGYIRKGLSDMELTKKGKFYDINEIENILSEPHRQALMNMLNNTVTESTSEVLAISALEIQKLLNDLHKKNRYGFITNVDVEYNKDKGFVFAQYNTTSKFEAEQVRQFVQYCNHKIKDSIYMGRVEEPLTYEGNGFLYLNILPSAKEKEITYNNNDTDID